jgi:hypothetical protein
VLCLATQQEGDDEEGSSSGSEGGDEEGSEEEEPRGRKAAGGGGGAVKKAAAALSVGVGHFTDPWSLLGLSHYLEHMLFMGSERYPDENDYDAFLTAHGGASNACTEEVGEGVGWGGVMGWGRSTCCQSASWAGHAIHSKHQARRWSPECSTQLLRHHHKQRLAWPSTAAPTHPPTLPPLPVTPPTPLTHSTPSPPCRRAPPSTLTSSPTPCAPPWTALPSSSSPPSSRRMPWGGRCRRWRMSLPGCCRWVLHGVRLSAAGSWQQQFSSSSGQLRLGLWQLGNLARQWWRMQQRWHQLLMWVC